MRKTIITLCTLFFLCFSASAHAQSKEKTDLDLHEVTLAELFSEVEDLYGFSFMYSNTDIDDSRKITLDRQPRNIDDLLREVFRGQPVRYEIASDRIILTKSDDPVRQSESAEVVSGRIVDPNNAPMAGVSVLVRGTNRGVITDSEGRFAIQASPDETLVITYMGFGRQEVRVGSRTTFNITLQEEQSLLDEVVVIGYGTLRKSDLTGALSSVDTKDLVTRATSNPAQALQGVVAGVNVQKSSGLVGSEISIKIRGVNTFGSNEPLYIIDGFPGNIATVNPNDIESMEILKDAAAAAIYGSVAANGVIIVTTKSGKQGETRIDINTYVSVTSTAKQLEMLDAEGYVTVHRQMYDAAGRAWPDYLTNPGSNNTNWQDEVFGTGFESTQSVAVRGGHNDTRYSISGNLTQEKGVARSNYLRQQNARMKISTKKSIFDIDAGMAFTNTKSATPNYSLKEVYMLSPLVAVYDPNEPDGYALTNWGDLPNNVNVMANDNYITSWAKKQEVEGNAAVGVHLMEGLTFRTSYGYRGVNTQSYYHNPPFVSDEKDPFAYAKYSETRSYLEEQIFDNLLSYNALFGRHSVNAMLGTSLTMQKYSWNYVEVEGKNPDGDGSSAGFLDPDFMTINAGTGGTYSAQGSKYQYNRMSYFGRVNYSFADRYLFQFTFRRDGSSKFGVENRYGNFPSVAVGWRINQEPFFPDNTVVSNLKLRASWGKLGNEVALDYYDHQALISTDNTLLRGYVQGGNPWPGSIALGLENQEKLRWETTVSRNIGLDYGFLNNRIYGTVNYFNNVTNDLLITNRLAPSAGLENPIMNVGRMRNSGMEFEFTYVKPTGDFRYTAGLNVSFLQNKVIALANDDQILLGNGLKWDTEHFPNQTRVGYPIGAFFLYQTDGIFQSEAEVDAHRNSSGELLQPNAEPGDIRFVDTNGDGVIDDNDKVYSGSGIPKVEVNLNLAISYKGFDFSMLIGSGWGHKLYNGNRYLFEGMSSGSNFLATTLNAWTPTNTDTDIPRAVLEDPNGNSRESDRFLEPGDFIRLRQVQIGYTLPKNLLRRIKSENLRIYVSGENLLTWTRYTGTDPEFAATGSSGIQPILNTGVDMYIYPFTRSFVFGIQYTF